VRVWTRFICSGYGQVAGSCEHGNEHSASVNDREVLD